LSFFGLKRFENVRIRASKVHGRTLFAIGQY